MRYTANGATVTLDVPGDPWRVVAAVERHLCDGQRDEARNMRWNELMARKKL